MPQIFQDLIISGENQTAQIGALSDQLHETRTKIETTCQTLGQKEDEIQELYNKNLSQEEKHRKEKKLLAKQHRDLVQGMIDSNQFQLKEFQKNFEAQELTNSQKIAEINADHATKISHFQEALLKNIDGFKPMTDSEGSGRFDRLRQKVHTLAWASTDFNSENLGRSFNQQSFISASKRKDHKYVLEAHAWEILFGAFFATPFCVLGSYGDSFTSTWHQIFKKIEFVDDSETHIWPQPSAKSETWRYVTFETLRCDLTGTKRLENLTRSYQKNLFEVKRSLSEAFGKFSDEDHAAEIGRIVNEASSLALEFGIQRSRWQLFAPKANTVISTRSSDFYDDLNRANSPVDDAKVRLVVKHGLEKTGDGRGGSFDTVAVLTSAGVFLTV